MALQLSYDDDFGVTHSEAYWRIIGTNQIYTDAKGMIMVAVYHNAAARQNGKRPLTVKNYQFGQNEFIAFGDFSYAIDETDVHYRNFVYTELKKLDEFDGAEDV